MKAFLFNLIQNGNQNLYELSSISLSAIRRLAFLTFIHSTLDRFSIAMINDGQVSCVEKEPMASRADFLMMLAVSDTLTSSISL